MKRQTNTNNKDTFRLDKYVANWCRCLSLFPREKYQNTVNFYIMNLVVKVDIKTILNRSHFINTLNICKNNIEKY